MLLALSREPVIRLWPVCFCWRMRTEMQSSYWKTFSHFHSLLHASGETGLFRSQRDVLWKIIVEHSCTHNFVSLTFYRQIDEEEEKRFFFLLFPPCCKVLSLIFVSELQYKSERVENLWFVVDTRAKATEREMRWKEKFKTYERRGRPGTTRTHTHMVTLTFRLLPPRVQFYWDVTLEVNE